jgi:hypothetical protein
LQLRRSTGGICGKSLVLRSVFAHLRRGQHLFVM